MRLAAACRCSSARCVGRGAGGGAASPLHQWAKTYMGLKPLHGRDWYASESYAVIDASKVLSWEPIVQIGIREWRPKSKFLGHVPARGGRNGKRKGRDREQPPKGVGEPLFANNVHAWSFG